MNYLLFLHCLRRNNMIHILIKVATAIFFLDYSFTSIDFSMYFKAKSLRVTHYSEYEDWTKKLTNNYKFNYKSFHEA